MATIEILHEPAVLRVGLSRFERAMMLRGSAWDIPLRAVTAARAESGWTSEILGLRTGLVVSGYLKIATFRHPNGTRRLVVMRRGEPLLRVRLTGHDFDELLLSTPDAGALAAALDARVVT